MTLAAVGGLCLGLVLGWLSAYRTVLASGHVVAAGAVTLAGAVAGAALGADAWAGALGWACGWAAAAILLLRLRAAA
jgi:hypothetical protein